MCFEHLCHERPFMLLIENEVPPINTLAMNPETELVRAEEEPETEVVFVYNVLSNAIWTVGLLNYPVKDML
ncbi:hypothetical protein V6N13_004654 [Hibiscus sabdariffa]